MSNYSIIPTTIFVWVLWLCSSTRSYIPALPTNLTVTTTTSGSGTENQNISAQNDTNWIIQLNWHPIGIFSDGIKHQLKSDTSNHSIYQGVLLHFSEFNATNQPPAVVPWIAMINCDSNSTVYSNQDDIFTLARDRGAAAAMLYSLTSHSCEINPEYLLNFEKPLDVFSAANLQGARLIESQFSNVLGAGYWFQSGLLNSSAPTILEQIKSLGLSNLTDLPPAKATPTDPSVQAGPNNQSNRSSLSESSTDPPLERRSNPLDQPPARHKLIARSTHPTDNSSHIKLNMNVSRHPTGSDTHPSPVYLIATLANAEITGSLDQQKQDRNQNSNFQGAPGNGSNSNTGLAMIILYAITGCVSFIFRFLVCLIAFACLPLPLLLSPHTDLGRFLIVIVSGAIRAIRNPDRYGPRPGGRVDPQTGEEDPYAQPRQTRAAGLGKAILDTFPIVKFGRQRIDPKFDAEGNSDDLSRDAKVDVDPSSPDEESVMMRQRGMNQPGSALVSNPNRTVKDEEDEIEEETRVNTSELSPSQILASQVPLMSRSRLSIDSLEADPPKGDAISSSVSQSARDETPTSHENFTSTPVLQNTTPDDDPTDEVSKTKEQTEVATELVDVNNSITCPICVCDFEDDDEIRMLPCDARHQFHKECVDPWLLNESKFCPLCRWDLSTRKDGSKIMTEVILAAESEGPSTPRSGHPISPTGQPDDESPSVLQNSQSASSSRSATREINTPRLSRSLPPWLSFGNGPSSSSPPTSDPERPMNSGSPRQRVQNRRSTLLSIVPHIRKRRQDSRQENSILHPDSVPSNPQQQPSSSPEPQANHHHLPLDNSRGADLESASKSRFNKYLAHIRRKKLPTPAHHHHLPTPSSST
ncbi:hypothetical protein MJO29_007733 [Puccinia striiformis f. sp. tritici]|uniref:RING-type E3 ubiquitin transferase n=1 Tax=Puccinia striiformis f. sp. tritici PST-78 TaxID=1165861 RepID=A0A0L0V731_9BASI|nr:hypothetical protein MJO29_007733 [Puccinia striiformis f. sp. tritici]KNE95083.1 hypothetical protein PSTG_11561 [Puccinia striiformis f. sp. tritici PST-78]